MLLTAPEAASPRSLESWIGDVCATFLREEPRWHACAPDRGPVTAFARAIPVDGILFGRSEMPACTIANGRAAARGGKYYLCQLSEPYRLMVEDGSERIVDPTQILVMSAHVPHRMTFDRPYLAHSLVVEEDLLRPWFLRMERLSPHVRCLPHRGGEIFRAVMSQTFELPESRIAAQSERVVSALVDILCAFGPDDDSPPSGRAARDRLMERARAFIGRALGQSDLRVADVAAHLNVSPRYLQKLFTERDLSVASYISEERLQRSARLLRSPQGAGLTITEIAYAHGFGDSSQFARKFRRRFGVSPRDYRAPRASA